ncbi:MAG TPA: hypothetical protein PLU47_00940 [Azonexus sp.]|nr:hypothetical protein [Azonexus sp.]
MAASIKQLAAGQRRSLASIKKRLEAMAIEWGEVDNGTMWLLQDLADKIEAASEEMTAFADETGVF